MNSLLEKNSVIKELFETQTAQSQTGETVPLTSNIRLAFAESLYRTVLKAKPKTAVEIGMAFGVSSLAILTALDEAGENGRLISLDPNQATHWQGCGVTAVKRAGFEKSHELIEKFDFSALPQMLDGGVKIDFAYIDGWHTFDYTLLDFWYIDKMLGVGGIVAFNDCHLPAVDKVINFVRSHRKYEELNVELPVEYTDYTPFREMKRLVSSKPRENFYIQAQDRYFKKTEDWEPAWDFYAGF